jgi:hypothetical protein
MTPADVMGIGAAICCFLYSIPLLVIGIRDGIERWRNRKVKVTVISDSWNTHNLPPAARRPRALGQRVGKG